MMPGRRRRRSKSLSQLLLVLLAINVARCASGVEEPLAASGVVVDNDGSASYDADEVASDVAAAADAVKAADDDIFAVKPVTRKRIRRKVPKPEVEEEEEEDGPIKAEPVAVVEVPVEEPAAPPFQVEFAVQVKRGDMRRFVVEVYPSWARVGSRRFGKLVDDKFYDGCRFFRVIEGFVAQFGLNGKPEINDKWNKKGKVLKDDPRNLYSNDNYTLTFATTGPKSRKTQVFINVGDNSHLNTMGFIPFARVITGKDVVDDLYGGYEDKGPQQATILEEGNSHLKKVFPKLSYIIKAKRLEDDEIIPEDLKMPAPEEPEIWIPPPEEEEEEEDEVPELPEDANIDVDKLQGF